MRRLFTIGAVPCAVVLALLGSADRIVARAGLVDMTFDPREGPNLAVNFTTVGGVSRPYIARLLP